MATAIIPLLARMALVHVVLLYGTNNTTLDGLTQEAIHNRMIGSKFVLGARIFYAMFIWISKLTVSEFLKRLTTSTWNKRSEFTLQGIRYFLLLTFLAVVIATLAECQPITHYWQVVPDPGPACRNGFAQLFTMGLTDIITDIVLILFPTFVIMGSTMALKRKITTILLYSLGVVLIAIAAYRIPAIVAVHGRQQRRSLWASLEILASAAAANAVIIGSFVRDRGVKKQRHRPNVSRTDSYVDEPSMNRTLTRRHWGNDSDEDLFKAMGGRMNSLHHDERFDEPIKQAPVIDLPHTHPYEDIEDDFFYEGKGKGHADRHASEALGLSDAGGLLPGSDRSSDDYHQTRNDSIARDFAAPASRGMTLAAALAESDEEDTVGGAQERATQQPLPPNGRATQPGPELDLQDPGGLLG